MEQCVYSGKFDYEKTEGSVSRRHLACMKDAGWLLTQRRSSFLSYLMNTAFYWRRRASEYRTDQTATRFSADTNGYGRDDEKGKDFRQRVRVPI